MVQSNRVIAARDVVLERRGDLDQTFGNGGLIIEREKKKWLKKMSLKEI